MIKTFNGGSWIRNSKMTSFEEADVVVFPGGSDIAPSLYGHKPIKGIRFNLKRDLELLDLMKKSIKAGKLLFCTCKSAQLVTALAGGWLIQDSNHRGNHMVTTSDGQEFEINSVHHQMCYPYDLPKEDYELLAWSKQLSDYHIIQGDKQLEFAPETLDENGLFKEPEIIWYPKLNAIAAQNHFECENSNSKESEDYINNLILEKLNKK